MKITDRKTPVKGAGQAGNAGPTRKTGSAGSGQSSETVKKAAVSVSSGDQITSALSGDASRRAEKVAQIKLEVDSGSYDIDSQKTADKLIDSLTDYSLA